MVQSKSGSSSVREVNTGRGRADPRSLVDADAQPFGARVQGLREHNLQGPHRPHMERTSMWPRRNQIAGPGHRPAAPLEGRRRRVEQIPSGADCFNWRPLVELVEGPAPRRIGFAARLQALYGRSPPDGDAK
jgi:hypothetical protein